MNFTHSKPNLVDPTLLKKVLLYREKTGNKYFNFNLSDDVKTWGLIILFLGILGYIFYYRYNNRNELQSKENNQESKTETENFQQPAPTSYHQVQTHHVNLAPEDLQINQALMIQQQQIQQQQMQQQMQQQQMLQKQQMDNRIGQQTRMQQDFRYITSASGEPSIPKKLPIDLGSDPKPININPTEKYQENKCGMRRTNPNDYSLQAKSFSNLNHTLIGGNFAPFH
jgi:hypothetical protein